MAYDTFAQNIQPQYKHGEKYEENANWWSFYKLTDQKSSKESSSQKSDNLSE